MKSILLSVFLLISISSIPFAENPKVSSKLVNINKNEIIELSKGIIKENDAKINIDDISINKIEYSSLYKDINKNNKENISVSFKVKKGSATEKELLKKNDFQVPSQNKNEDTITYQTIIVNLDINGKPGNCAVLYGSMSHYRNTELGTSSQTSIMQSFETTKSIKEKE